MDYKDQRKHERIFFNPKDDYRINVSLPTKKVTCHLANILSLSEMGISFSINKDSGQNIKPDMKIKMDHTKENFPLTKDGTLEIIVKYKLDYDQFDFLTVGGQFVNMGLNKRFKLRTYIKNILKEEASNSGINI